MRLTRRLWLPRYHSIRIDAVHYCQREGILADKRKRRSFFDRNGEPEDTAEARLRLLCRTLREDPARLGPLVQFFKTPYMLRESRQADLARTIAVLPNLRYVDLPEGMFMDDPAYLTLRLEVQARCHNLRKMTYISGAERSLEGLGDGNIFRNLEVLELVRINMEPTLLRHVIGTLGNLRALKVTEAKGGPHCFTDDLLFDNPMVAEMPPLEELILTDVACVTAEGMQHYLSRHDTRATLRVLTLSGTSVHPWHLPEILSLAHTLRHLTIVDDVRATLPVAAGTPNILPLASTSLRTLNYEITSDPSAGPYSGVTRSYYNYLSGSLISGGLPNLRTVYVRDASFPDSLAGLPAPPVLPFANGAMRRPASSGSSSGFSSTHHSPDFRAPPPVSFSNGPFQNAQLPPLKQLPNSMAATPWAAGHNPRFSTNNPFAALISPQQVQTLEVFTKGDDDIDWSAVQVSPDDVPVSADPGRPHSSYGLGSEYSSAAGARKSVFMSTGAGHFLAVPDQPSSSAQNGRLGASPVDEWPRPKSSSAGEKKRERLDLWR